MIDYEYDGTELTVRVFDDKEKAQVELLKRYHGLMSEVGDDVEYYDIGESSYEIEDYGPRRYKAKITENKVE